jgi:MFS family permease
VRPLPLFDRLRRPPTSAPRPDDLPSADESYNGRLLRLEGIFASIVFGTLPAFYALYAIRLGASNSVIGWLTAGPSLLNTFWQIPCGRLIQRMRSYRPVMLGGVVFQRLFIMALALVVFLPAQWAPWGIVALVTLSAFPSSLWGIAMQAAWGDMFSRRQFPRMIGLRWAAANTTTLFLVLLLGRWVDSVRYPLNFQLMFAVVGFISLASLWMIAKYRLPAVARSEPQPPASNASFRPALGASLRRYRKFIILQATAFVGYVAIYAAQPLFRIYWVRDLGAAGGWIGALTAAWSLGTTGGNIIWGRWSHPRRNRRLLLLCALGLMAIYPLATAAFHSLPPLLGVNLLVGFLAGGSDLMILNRSMELAPRDQRASLMAVYSSMIAASGFVAPLISTRLADLWGARSVLALAGGLGLVGAALIFSLGWGQSPAETELL